VDGSEYRNRQNGVRIGNNKTQEGSAAHLEGDYKWRFFIISIMDVVDGL
jgi:hypothetical protein